MGATTRIRGFDGLRAIAFLWVYLTHKGHLGIVSMGGYGVHLFFVLSGFLIIGILHGDRQEIERGHLAVKTTLARFYTSRMFRIWPVYLVVVLIAALIRHFQLNDPYAIDEWISLMTFTVNLFVGYVWPEYPRGYGALWSVAVEEQFYLLAAPLLLLTPARAARRICMATILVAVSWGLCSVYLDLPRRSLYVGSLTNFGLMALGGLAALTPVRCGAWVRWAPIALVIYLAMPIIDKVIGVPPLTNLTFWLSPILVAIVLKSIAVDQGGWLVAALECWPLRKLGVISYGCYMYHQLVPMELLEKAGLGPAALLADFLLMLLIATASWRWIEQPLMQSRHRINDKHWPTGLRAKMA